jgi:hypothetical protein
MEDHAGDVAVYNVGEEETVLQSTLLDLLEQARELNADWWAAFEDTDVETCDRATLVGLMQDAPTDGAKLFLFGKYQFRLAIAAITERGFS